MADTQNNHRIERLASNATVAQRIAKINELIEVINDLFFPEDLTETE